MIKIIKKTGFLFVFLLAIITNSCTKHVPSVPILIDMNGFSNVKSASDFKDELEQKLRKYGFVITNDISAPYRLKVHDLYNYSYSFVENAPYDDCSNGNYYMTGYEYGIKVSLIYKDSKIVEEWNSSRSKEDELVEKDEYGDCKTYKIREPLLLDGAFFRQRAVDIAKRSANLVAKEY